jgi:hypothetical protein
MTLSKTYPALIWLGAASLGLMLAACGSGGISTSAVSGQALTEASIAGAITLKDSSVQTQTRTAVMQADGTFSVEVAGLSAPYLLRAEWTDSTGPQRLYAVSEGSGNVDINAITDAAYVHASSGYDEEEIFEHSDQGGKGGTADRARALLAGLSTALAPLFDRYGITSVGIDRMAVRALLKDVMVKVQLGVVTVTNRATGAVIFVGPLSDLASGTFNAANMPAGPGAPPPSTCTSFAYSAYGDCQPGDTQSRTVVTRSPAGCSGGLPITSQACTYVPPANPCTSFTYAAYGACQVNNTQTRAVLTSAPTRCSGGAPITSQACVYAPPVACTSFTYSAFGACQMTSTQTRTVLTSVPTGCGGGSPVTSQACVYTTPTDGGALYTRYCAGCHGNAKKGSTPSAIQGAINSNRGGMGSAALMALTPTQVAAISAAP